MCVACAARGLQAVTGGCLPLGAPCAPALAAGSGRAGRCIRRTQRRHGGVPIAPPPPTVPMAPVALWTLAVIRLKAVLTSTNGYLGFGYACGTNT